MQILWPGWAVRRMIAKSASTRPSPFWGTPHTVLTPRASSPPPPPPFFWRYTTPLICWTANQETFIKFCFSIPWRNEKYQYPVVRSKPWQRWQLAAKRHFTIPEKIFSVNLPKQNWKLQPFSLSVERSFLFLVNFLPSLSVSVLHLSFSTFPVQMDTIKRYCPSLRFTFCAWDWCGWFHTISKMAWRREVI